MTLFSPISKQKRPFFKVPNLAIHLRTDKAKWDENTETHLRPIFSTQVYEKLLKPEGEPTNGAKIYEVPFFL